MPAVGMRGVASGRGREHRVVEVLEASSVRVLVGVGLLVGVARDGSSGSRVEERIVGVVVVEG